MSFLKNRDLRYRSFAKIINGLSRTSSGRRLVATVRNLELMNLIYKKLIGYYRPFATLSEANLALATQSNGGHENSINIDWHLGLSRMARPSDYAAFYHLRNRSRKIRRVYDVGGNVGNLFYCYQHYLEWPNDLEWKVNDLPVIITRGKILARERGISKLVFSDKWQDASGADLLIASGALHYFMEPLATMMNDLPTKPSLILINRTPMTEGPPLATVQDAGFMRVPCMLYNRTEFVESITRLGYTLVDQWSVAEVSFKIPGYTEHSAGSYWGMFFINNSGAAESFRFDEALTKPGA